MTIFFFLHFDKLCFSTRFRYFSLPFFLLLVCFLLTNLSHEREQTWPTYWSKYANIRRIMRITMNCFVDLAMYFCYCSFSTVADGCLFIKISIKCCLIWFCERGPTSNTSLTHSIVLVDRFVCICFERIETEYICWMMVFLLCRYFLDMFGSLRGWITTLNNIRNVYIIKTFISLVVHNRIITS